ncbi:MAG: acetate kinase [Clostridia bacterium]|nr:acetate kinase [Clostridia bacterium]MBQ4575040.1 acetate kinase [Clostridia bacterium]
MKVLVVNAGSSSLKYQLFDTATGSVLAKGICERIGIDGKIEHKQADGTKTVREIEMKNHSVATRILVDTLTDPTIGCIKSMDEIEAVGHRVVHGGAYFSESVLVTPEVIEKLKKCVDLAPLHTPAHLMGIEGITNEMPNVPQVLVFDTAFHQTMPEYAWMYPIPYEMYEKYSIRRYGAHGTSHRFVAGEMCKLLGKTEGTKIVTCHLGNGSSISAVKDGKVVDTSMGFTPLDGVEMGTRCGSIDPAIVTFIMEHEGMAPGEMSDFMNKKCGFLGVSGISSDSRDIEAAILKGDHRAWLAANILAYQIKKYIGSYAAAMNGLDAIVFTAGMGENNPELRERVCTDMEYYGIKIDNELNAKTHHQPNIVKLSTPESKVEVWLIPTNEELVIASDTEKLATK